MIKRILGLAAMGAGMLAGWGSAMAQTSVGALPAAQAGAAGTGGYSIAAYGAKGDGQTLDTRMIQAAVDDCHQHGGGRVVIPVGRWVTGTIRLYGNMELHFEPGATLVGSLDDKDYLWQKDFGFEGPGAGVKTGILVAHGETNIAVTGFGVIDGNGDHFVYPDSLQIATDYRPEYTRQGHDYANPAHGRADGPVLWKGTYAARPGVMAIFSSCTRVTVRDIRFMASPNWTMAFFHSSDVKVSGLTIQNNMSIPNSDGVDFYDSKNISVSDCHIDAGDDAIAVISSSHLTVTNCVLHSRSAGIRIGYNVFNTDDSEDMSFDNISIFDSNRGIGIFQRQGGNMSNISFSNIVIHTRLHTGGWWGHGEPIHISSIPGLGSKTTGSISHVHFSHITADSESGIVVYADAPGLIRDVYFSDIDLSIKAGPLSATYGGNIDLRPANDLHEAIFKRDLPALYTEYADRVTIDGLQVRWEKGVPAYFTHAVECGHYVHADVERVTEENEAGSGRAREQQKVLLRRD